MVKDANWTRKRIYNDVIYKKVKMSEFFSRYDAISVLEHLVNKMQQAGRNENR